MTSKEKLTISTGSSTGLIDRPIRPCTSTGDWKRCSLSPLRTVPLPSANLSTSTIRKVGPRRPSRTDRQFFRSREHLNFSLSGATTMEATDSYFVIGLQQNVSAMGCEFTLLT